ncbi:hypothetical protein J2I47_12895 [Fibrella sp. HMF5335]|uniref:Uncharacterized protein n=1 Tax=Fibrella rubiginis TaxID=2817060 RepID=A0A939GIM8_9BACT|nr:hypothetical protein [Fibrella rubiginis]MBO0937446.1 hypothetical protein [Fibrella rubiginis]
MKALFTLLCCANAMLATAQTVPANDTVRFECPNCQGNMKLMINGKGTNMTYEQKSSSNVNTLFPVAMPLPPGKYYYTYWQNGVQQMHLPFIIKAGEKNVVTVK